VEDQRDDGSFRYTGKMRPGHFEDTASAYCAEHAVLLLDFARYTGDARYREAGIKALEFIKRFRTPRGGQLWELPLHAPDLSACYWLVMAYVRGYEITGRSEYLGLAHRWALSGLPFVYQWSRFPIMAYGTVPAIGATDWTGITWIGIPVQWCGVRYACALMMLARYDPAPLWRQLATGILGAAEQMQYPDGPFSGCIPDSFDLTNQRRLPASTNPCALLYLQRLLEGQSVGLQVAAKNRHHVVSPYPLAFDGHRATISGQRGRVYQLVIDGQRIVEVNSQGTDVVEIDLASGAQEKKIGLPVAVSAPINSPP
jgi:hypothetical protein